MEHKEPAGEAKPPSKILTGPTSARASSLRARSNGVFIVSQTGSQLEIPPMWFTFLSRKLKPRSFAPRRLPAFRPVLEALEDRCLPSTLTVLNTLDTGAGSLRDTIAAAQSGDTIVFDPSLDGQTITLTSGELTIDKSLDLHGPGGKRLPLIISGNNTSRVLDVTLSGATVTLANLSITGGVADQGGGILNEGGKLGLANCSLLGGAVTITNSTFYEDYAHDLSSAVGGNARGGTIYALGSSLTITKSTFNDDDFNGGFDASLGGVDSSGGDAQGGAIYAADSTVKISDSTLESNRK